MTTMIKCSMNSVFMHSLHLDFFRAMPVLFHCFVRNSNPVSFVPCPKTKNSSLLRRKLAQWFFCLPFIVQVNTKSRTKNDPALVLISLLGTGPRSKSKL